MSTQRDEWARRLLRTIDDLDADSFAAFLADVDTSELYGAA